MLRFRVRRHADRVFIVGIEHRAIARHFDDDALDLGELLERVDALQTQMIGLHVEHRAHIRERHAHAGTQQPAARGLEHRDVDARIGEHHARRDRPGHVALDGALAVDVDAVGGREPRREARHLGDVREHARRRGLAVGAGDAGDRHPRGGALAETACRSRARPRRAACPRSARRACENRARR
jgi:hypothetical protein